MSTDPVQDVLNRPPREQTKKEEKRTGAITISNTHVEAWAKVKRLTKREAAEELIGLALVLLTRKEQELNAAAVNEPVKVQQRKAG